jgi:hypothetical protein
MSKTMVHSRYHAPGLELGRAAWPAARSARRTSWPRSALSALRMLCIVLEDALAAHRSYERLRRKGVPDAKAIRRAFLGSER